MKFADVFAAIVIVVVGAALYLGIGALMHAVVVGPQFDFNSAWTWGMLLAWPAAAFAIVCLIWVLVTGFTYIALGIGVVFGVKR